MSDFSSKGRADSAIYNDLELDGPEVDYAEIREFLARLDLPVSSELARHATSTYHEDLPHVHNHECGIACLIESRGATTDTRGTTTPSSSNRNALERFHSFIPPANYGAVIPDRIYRSSYPAPENYEFIRDLRIKSILTLVPEPISPQYQEFMKEAGIQHFQVHIKANKGQVSTESCEMSRALRLIMDRTNHPILIHCNKGKHRTGCTVACFQRILGYSPEQIFQDYHTYATRKARFWDEVFFENFDLNLVMWYARLEGWVAPDIEIAPPLVSATRFAIAAPVA